MQAQQIDTFNDYPLYQIDCDINGNSRYVIHFLAIPFRDRTESESFPEYIDAHMEHAKKALYGRKYRAKWFGGGIVFTASEGARKRVEHAVNYVQVDLELATTEVENDTILVNPDRVFSATYEVRGIFSEDEDEAEWNRIADAKLKGLGFERISDWDDKGRAHGVRISL